MSYDKLANRYLDKVFPASRQEITEADLRRAKIDPAMLPLAHAATESLTRQGIKPTVEAVVQEVLKAQKVAQRRGI